MPITKSAIKRMRSDRRKYLRNQVVRSELKTILRKVTLLAEQNFEKAKEEARALTSRLDKAARKGIIPRTKASRRKSRLARLLAKHKPKS